MGWPLSGRRVHSICSPLCRHLPTLDDRPHPHDLFMEPAAEYDGTDHRHWLGEYYWVYGRVYGRRFSGGFGLFLTPLAPEQER